MSNQKLTCPHLIKVKDIDFHDLKDKWTFYYLIPNRQNSQNKEWKNFLRKFFDFQTFEDYWAIINTIDSASQLQKGCRYYIFKNDITPLWEDEKNFKGIEIFSEYPASNQKGHNKKMKFQSQQEKCEEDWIKLTSTILGNTFKYGDCVNGIEFNCRGAIYKVGIWANSSVTHEKLAEIKAELKKFLKGSEIKHTDINVEPPVAPAKDAPKDAAAK